MLESKATSGGIEDMKRGSTGIISAFRKTVECKGTPEARGVMQFNNKIEISASPFDRLSIPMVVARGSSLGKLHYPARFVLGMSALFHFDWCFDRLSGQSNNRYNSQRDDQNSCIHKSYGKVATMPLRVTEYAK